MKKVTVIGAGLSGCEAALQLATRGIKVDLYEMRPTQKTPAHKTENVAELVCSNSLKGLGLSGAHGLFKHELELLGSKLLKAARSARVKAGDSLTVDRDIFSAEVKKMIDAEENITFIQEEVTEINPDEITIIAAGPLCSQKLSEKVFDLVGTDKLNFFDAIAPVVTVDSIDFNHAYTKNRWEKGTTKDFINCPLDKETYNAFVAELVAADQVEPKPYEPKELFEGCLPVEEIARRGEQTLNHGPMRPKGLMDENGHVPYAVLQLRAENMDATLYNMVGFQTRLKWETQKRIFRMVPALKNAEFARLGVMHRNTFIDSPKALDSSLRAHNTNVFFAGQITGAEGYTEAIGTGFFTGLQAYSLATKGETLPFPEGSCLHALVKHLTSPNEDFQPMNFNFGLLPPKEGLKKAQKKMFHVDTAIVAVQNFVYEKLQTL
ncbi:MAG: methylenetetrahydrofolate--tRNA-(uracil(54)-C(5))-methyltransferase (FADH(2)-oxidizing) TrmFO [Fibrobacterales bacterium]